MEPQNLPRVLYIANAALTQDGTRFYNTDNKIFNGLVRLGCCVYYFSDRDTARASTLLASKLLGAKRANKRLLKVFDTFQPDIVLISNHGIIKPETIGKMRERNPNVRIGQYNVDAAFNDHNFNRIKEMAKYTDANFITTAGLVLEKLEEVSKKYGSRCYYIPNCCDTSIETLRCFERSDQEYDLFFAGSIGAHDKGRAEFLDKLIAHPEINFNYHGFYYKPKLGGAKYFQEISNAKMGLNLSRTAWKRKANVEELYLYSSDRLAHFMANGLLTFSHVENNLHDLFAEDELVYFTTAADLIDKVTYYKNHDKERRKIAEKGWRKYHEHFNEKIVASFMLEMIQGNKPSKKYIWAAITS
jgi:hypothetical protein